MSTVYFTSYKGPGFRTEDAIPEGVDQINAARCAGLVSAVAPFHRAARPTHGVYRGTWEPAFFADIEAVHAVRFARAAVVLWEQDCALVFTADADAPTHVRVTVRVEHAPVVLAYLAPDGYTVLPSGDHVFIQSVPDGLAFPDDVPCTVEWGRAAFVTA